MFLTNAEWTRETNVGHRSRRSPMNNKWRVTAIGCAVAGFIVFDGFGMLCVAQPVRAELNERLQFLEWCGSNELDMSSGLVIRGCSEVIRAGTEAPKNLAVAFNNRGNGYVLSKDYDRAIADYTEAIKLDPNFVTAYNGRAGAYSDAGEVDRAAADYIEARRIALKSTGDRTVSEPKRGHTPAITLVNLEPPTPAAAVLGAENRTVADGPKATLKSNPIVQSSLRNNADPVRDVPDGEPVLKPGKRLSAAGDTAARPLSDRADNAAAPAAAAGQPGLLFGDSNARHLTRSELQKLSAEQLQIARNEIFARKGRYFKDDRLNSYFAKFSWYQPAAWDVPLNPVEKANVDLIRSIEDLPALHSVVSRSVPSTKPRNGDKVIRAANIKAE